MSARISKGSIALVTGASSGFGLLTCLELADSGMRVFASMRNLERRGELDQAMAAEKLTCEVVGLDVTEPDSISAALAHIESRGGPVDVLVNNAGYGLGGFAEDLTLDEYRAQFETNFFGLVATTKAVIPSMRQRRRGRIINISSMAGLSADPGMSAYSASKFAVEGFSESLRHELLPHDVYVSLIEPGMFRTEIFDRNRRVGARALDPVSPNYRAAQRIVQMLDDRLAASKADPRDVARLIAEVVTSRRPRLRYLVGSDARIRNMIQKTVPASLWERAVVRFLAK